MRMGPRGGSAFSRVSEGPGTGLTLPRRSFESGRPTSGIPSFPGPPSSPTWVLPLPVGFHPCVRKPFVVPVLSLSPRSYITPSSRVRIPHPSFQGSPPP